MAVPAAPIGGVNLMLDAADGVAPYAHQLEDPLAFAILPSEPRAVEAGSRFALASGQPDDDPFSQGDRQPAAHRVCASAM